MEGSIAAGRKCRACLGSANIIVRDWSASAELATGRLSYSDCFRECTQLSVELDQELLPKCLCAGCAQELKVAYQFIRKAQRSDEMLRSELDGVFSRTPAATTFEWVSVPKEETSTESVDRKTFEVRGEVNPPSVEYSRAQPEERLGALSSADEARHCNGRRRATKRACKDRSSSGPSRATAESKARRVQCEYCSASYTAEPQLKRHIARTHKEQQQLHLCHACPRTFRDASTLRQHTLTHEEDRERNYACAECDRKFFTHSAYQSHAKTHDSTRQPQFECDQCDKTFFHKGSLKLHQQHHTGAKIECTICQKRYLRQVDLAIHLRSHSGDAPYKCTLCDKAFTQMGILNKHVRHHEGYRYRCEQCGKEYTHQSTLIQHRKEHTGLPLKCALCDKGFVKKSKMRRHIGGVHKVKELEEVDKLIVKVRTKREYRGRMLEPC